MVERHGAAYDPFAMNPWIMDPWTRAMTSAFRFWVSFWPVAPLFGVEWRFAEMGHAPDPLSGPGRETVPPGEALQPPAAEPGPVAEEVNDLTRIKGIGPGVARQLEALGIRSFAQIAGLTEEELAAIDEKLTSIKGRCFRDDWIGQARALAV